MIYFAVLSFVISFSSTVLVRKLALKFGVVDRPDKNRKFHDKPVALLGGIGIFVSFWMVVGVLAIFKPIFGIEILNQKLLGSFIASLLILIIGIADDLRPFSAKYRLALTSVAVILAIYFGMGLQKITNPFGGVINLSLVIGNIFVFLWLIGMMYTTKITDGLDGLSGGVVTIGAFMIFFLSNSAKFFQPNVALLALIFAGACLGFLVLNFYPAKIFLGEGGSLLVGFLLGVLAVISGGKLATALLVMAIPVFDLARVIYLRLKNKKPLFEGDRLHLHFQLLNYGFKPVTVVLLYYVVATILGTLALGFQSSQKILVLSVLLIVMLFFGAKLKKFPA